MEDELAAVAQMVQRKTTQFNMRMDPELKEVAEKAAAADRRSLASLVEKLLEDYCRGHGLLKPERKTRRHD
jgi:predicted HicB family RNase H-like nuclease